MNFERSRLEPSLPYIPGSGGETAPPYPAPGTSCDTVFHGMKSRLCTRAPVLAIAAILLAGFPQPANTQDQPAGPSWELVFENDVFFTIIPFTGRSDREYTHGHTLATERDHAPVWGRLFSRIGECTDAAEVVAGTAADDAVHTDTPATPWRDDHPRCLRTRYELGQKLYTPDTTSGRTPSPEERPFAGWLYGAVTGRILDSRSSRSLRMEIGVTGPPSFGEETQRFVHWVIQTYEPQGWDDQLPFEPAILVRYEERHRVLERLRDDGSSFADVIATGGASLGNLRTGLEAALTVRVGRPLPHPWLPRSSPAPRFVPFAFVEARGRWTAHDLFLDGTVFEESRGVDRRPFAAGWSAGAAADYRDFRVRVELVGEGRQYLTQPEPHRYFSISLTWRP